MASLDRKRLSTKARRACGIGVIRRRFSLGACPEMPDRRAGELEECRRNLQDPSTFRFPAGRSVQDPVTLDGGPQSAHNKPRFGEWLLDCSESAAMEVSHGPRPSSLWSD